MSFQRYIPMSLAILSLSNSAFATLPDGQLDPGFGGNGVTTIGFSAAGYNTANLFGMAQPGSGKLLVLGKPTESGELGTLELARLLPDGTLDNGFGNNGRATSFFDVGVGRAIADANGGAFIILTELSMTSGSFGAICRLTKGGDLDTNYASGGCRQVSFPGSTLTSLNSGALQSDGSVILAGFATSNATGYKQAALTRITTTGALDTSFAASGYFLDSCAGAELAATTNCALFTVTVTSDRIYAAGEITVNAIDSDIIVLALTSGGALDNNFHGNGRAVAAFDLTANVEMHDRGLAVVTSPGGGIAVGGYAGYAPGPPLLTKAAAAFFDAQGNSTGAGTFYLGTSSGYTSRIDVLALQGDGKVLLAGTTQTQQASHLQFAAARIAAGADHHPDTNFGDGTGNGLLVDFGVADGAAAEATAIAFDGTRPVIAGTRTATSGDSEFAVIRLTSELIFANGFE